ncbi:DUF4342 domain-containing protein [Balneolales bacterium ANBcel1]|nr:DUF4342 domain-containing protein [Balneolales bacterium ANBcel1]
MAHDLVQEFRVSGRELVDRVRDILREGNVRRLVIKNSRDEILFDIPLSVGMVGVGGAFALAPILSSIAAFAFFARDARIVVERSSGRRYRLIENELSDNPDPERFRHRSGTGNDPFEIETDFEIIDPQGD